MTTTAASITNGTINTAKDNQILNVSFQVSMIGVQVSIMLGMGAIITVKDIIEHCKRPLGVIIAMISQFFAMPATAFGLVHLIQLTPLQSVSAMILACCPGGSASNLFAYFCDGDVPLSIMLTTMSTILALGFMPLNLWIYTRSWTNADKIKVPYEGIAITLAWVLVPLAFGMAAKKWTPKLALCLQKLGSICGMFLIWVGIVLQFIMDPHTFGSGWKLWLTAAAIPTGGFIVGFFLSFILRQSSKHQRTIALETGMQSIGLATTISLTSFPKDQHPNMIPLLIMCGIYLNGAGLLLTVFIRVRNLSRKKSISITKIVKNDQKEVVVNTIT